MEKSGKKEWGKNEVEDRVGEVDKAWLWYRERLRFRLEMSLMEKRDVKKKKL